MSNNGLSTLFLCAEGDLETTIICGLIAHQTDAMVCMVSDYAARLGGLEWKDHDGTDGDLADVDEIHLLRPCYRLVDDRTVDVSHLEICRWPSPDNFFIENHLYFGPFEDYHLARSKGRKLCYYIGLFSCQKRLRKIKELLDHPELVESSEQLGIAVRNQQKTEAEAIAKHALVFGDFAATSVGFGSNIALIHEAMDKEMTFIHYIRLVNGAIRHCWSINGEDEENLFEYFFRCDRPDYRQIHSTIGMGLVACGTSTTNMTFEDFVKRFTTLEC